MDGLEFVRLGIDDERDPSFDCGDPDLNEFFLEDSKANCRELLAVTYAWRLQDKTIAYFSVLTTPSPANVLGYFTIPRNSIKKC